MKTPLRGISSLNVAYWKSDGYRSRPEPVLFFVLVWAVARLLRYRRGERGSTELMT
jgi:hypothetical protein